MVTNDKTKKRSLELKYVIVGDPIPLARPRMNHKTVFDSQKKLKMVWGYQIQKQHSGPQLEGPLQMDITFFMPFPKTMSQSKRDKLCGTYHLIRPDTSNMIKFVEDCAQGIVFNDDCQISVIVCKKVYDNISRTEFTITELK